MIKKLSKYSRCRTNTHPDCGGDSPRDANQATMWITWIFGCPVDHHEQERPYDDSVPVCPTCWETIVMRWMFGPAEFRRLEDDDERKFRE